MALAVESDRGAGGGVEGSHEGGGQEVEGLWRRS